MPAPVASMNGQLGVTWLGTHWYDSTAPAAAWQLLHTGPYEIFSAQEAPANNLYLAIMATAAGAGVLTTQRGVQIGCYCSGGVQTQEWKIGNGSGAVLSNSAANAGVSGTAQFLNFAYSEVLTPKRVARFKESVLSSGATSAAPAASAPFATLRIGADAAGGNTATSGTITAEDIIFDRVLTATERAVVRAYLAVKFANA
jgi:hypothetical protein